MSLLSLLSDMSIAIEFFVKTNPNMKTESVSPQLCGMVCMF